MSILMPQPTAYAMQHFQHPSSTPVSTPSSFASSSPRSSVLSISSADEDDGDMMLQFHSEPKQQQQQVVISQPQQPAVLQVLKQLPQPIPQHCERICSRHNLSTNSTATTEAGSSPASSRKPSHSVDSSSPASSLSAPYSLPHSSSDVISSSTPISKSSRSSFASDIDLSSLPPVPSPMELPGIFSTARYGELYTDSTHFDDLPQLVASSPNLLATHISEIRVWARNFVHGLQTQYEVENKRAPTLQSESHKGKVHTAEYSMKVFSKLGEYVVGVEGTYREWIESLTIITNKQRYTFGRIARNGKFFRCAIPTGHRVVGFYGSYGVHLHNIGCYTAPISAQDKKRRGTCLVEKLKAVFRS